MTARVLVVDDDRAMSEFLVGELEEKGFSAQGCTSGRAAFDALAVASFDVVVTDLNMPQMNGLAFCERAAVEHPQVPVIVLTAFGSIETAVAAMRILEKIGFRHLNQVDPFDGGPYLGCARDAIASVRARKELVLPSLADDEPQAMREPLALLSAEGSFGFRATVVPLDDDDFPCVSKECREALGVAAGDRVAVTPLP